MDDINNRLERIRWRAEMGAKKLHPITPAQKAALREALSEHLKQNPPQPKQKKPAAEQAKKSAEQTKSQSQTRNKGMSHGH